MAEIIIARNNNRAEYDLVSNGNETLKGKFLNWRNNCPTEVEITQNSLNTFHILQVDVVRQSFCRGQDRTCNELQIKAETGRSDTGTFSINNAVCDLNRTKVIYLEYNPEEIENDEHNNMQCSICIIPFGVTPDTHQGSILIGG